MPRRNRFDSGKTEYRTGSHFVIIQRFHSALHLWTVYEGEDILGPMKAQGKAGTHDDAQTAAEAWIRENGRVETAGQPQMTL